MAATTSGRAAATSGRAAETYSDTTASLYSGIAALSQRHRRFIAAARPLGIFVARFTYSGMAAQRRGRFTHIIRFVSLYNVLCNSHLASSSPAFGIAWCTHARQRAYAPCLRQNLVAGGGLRQDLVISGAREAGGATIARAGLVATGKAAGVGKKWRWVRVGWTVGASMPRTRTRTRTRTSVFMSEHLPSTAK